MSVIFFISQFSVLKFLLYSPKPLLLPPPVLFSLINRSIHEPEEGSSLSVLHGRNTGSNFSDSQLC